MNAAQQTTILHDAGMAINTPSLLHYDIKSSAGLPDSEGRVRTLAENAMRTLNLLVNNISSRIDVEKWLETLRAEYLRLEAERVQAHPFTSDVSNIKNFTLALVTICYTVILTIFSIAGLGAVLNTVASAISSSGEVASLTGNWWASATFATPVIVFALLVDFTYQMIRSDKVKDRFRKILFTLAAITLVCWLVLLALAYPLGGASIAVSDNLFADTAPRKAFDAVTWYFPVQILLEILVGSYAGVAVAHKWTQGRTVIITDNTVHRELNDRQRENLQDTSAANRMLGAIDDYLQRYEAAVAVYTQSSIGILRRYENQLTFLLSSAHHNFFDDETDPNEE